MFSKTESFDEAKKYRDTFRSQKSAVYNAKRLVEQPIPSLEPEEFDAENTLSNVENLPEKSQSVDEIENAIETTVHNESSSTESAVHDDTQTELNSSQTNEMLCEPSQLDDDENNHEIEEYNRNETPSTHLDNVKNSFTPVQVDNDESLAIDGLFNASENIGSNDAIDANSDVSPSLENVILSANETASINSKGQVVVTRIVDKDVECVYIYGERPVPLAPFYHIKLNDLVSGNIPFKENVSWKLCERTF